MAFATGKHPRAGIGLIVACHYTVRL